MKQLLCCPYSSLLAEQLQFFAGHGFPCSSCLKLWKDFNWHRPFPMVRAWEKNSGLYCSLSPWNSMRTVVYGFSLPRPFKDSQSQISYFWRPHQITGLFRTWIQLKLQVFFTHGPAKPLCVYKLYIVIICWVLIMGRAMC